MTIVQRIDNALNRAIDHATANGCPPRFADALQYAVFSGGARVRPRLCLAVASACGDDDPMAANAAAAAIELMHCASLVHDDLPCFDNAELRRGKPSVHKAYGEPLAVLVGDALIVLAFETLGRDAARHPERLTRLLLTIGRCVGAPYGICAGQAWESEPIIVLEDYQRAKTGSLFVAATSTGAAAAGADPKPWQILGERLGEAYQVADDLRDALLSPQELGKPACQDETLGRPNATIELGVDGAVGRLQDLIHDAVGSIPDCPGAAQLRELVMLEVKRLVPKKHMTVAA
ncbi:MAG: polyprenyl synthetase family protein [Pseudomonadota bacterium]